MMYRDRLTQGLTKEREDLIIHHRISIQNRIECIENKINQLVSFY